MLGFLISFLQTMIRMSLVITLVGGIDGGFVSPKDAPFGWSSAVELALSFDRLGPSLSLCRASAPCVAGPLRKLNSLRPNSSYGSWEASTKGKSRA